MSDVIDMSQAVNAVQRKYPDYYRNAQAHIEMCDLWGGVSCNPCGVIEASERITIELAAHLRDPELTPAAAAVQHELALHIQAAIELLDERDRDIILMRHYEQLSNQEIAVALEITEPAASMRYLRALQRLRGKLAAAGQ